MLAACPHCGAPVDTERGQFCSACGGQVLQAYGQPAPPLDLPVQAPVQDQTVDPVPVIRARRGLPYRRKRSQSSKAIAVLTTLALAGSSIASALIIRSSLLHRQPQQQVAHTTIERPERPRVSISTPRRREPTPDRSFSGKLVVPTDAQLEAAKKELTLVGEFSANDFLEQANDHKHPPTMRYLLYQMCIDKAIKDGNLPITMRAVDGVVADWDIGDPDDYRRDVQRRFAGAKPLPPPMSEEDLASETSEESKNTVVTIDRGNSLVLKGTAVDLKKSKSAIPITLTHADVDPRSLYVEVTGVEGATPEKYYPSDRRAKMGSKLRIAFRDTAPHAGIQVSLSGGVQIVYVRLEPILIAFDRKEYPWTIDRTQKFLAQVTSLVENQTAAIPAAKAEFDKAAADLNAIVARYGDNMTAAPVVALKAAAVTRMNRAKAAFDELTAQLPINRRRAKAAGELGMLTEAVHDMAVVHFRLFYLKDGSEIEIARTE